MFFYKTPIDYLVITLDSEGLVASSVFKGVKGAASELPPGLLRSALDQYFYEKKDTLARFLSKGAVGTVFQRQVWGVISKIPFGKTATYKELAEKLGNPNASRAFGTACGKNPVALFIPCHRVVRTSGEDFGYSWGKERKEWLLAHEGVSFCH